MQPFIGPPIPIHLLATTSGWMRLFVVALIAVSLVFLVRVSRFLNRWGKRLDEQQRQREERERESEQRHAESM